MWGSLFGSPAAQECPPPPSSLPASGPPASGPAASAPPPSGRFFALGEDPTTATFGDRRYDSLGSNFSSSGGLPAGLKAARTAEAVRCLGTTKLEAAWNKLREEYAVQQLVWESVLRLQPDRAAGISSLRVALEMALKSQDRGSSGTGPAAASGAAGTAGAVRLLDQLVQKSEARKEFSRSMVEAARKVLALSAPNPLLKAHRDELAARIETSVVAASLPFEEKDKQEVEKLLQNCELDDAKLERTIRQMLLLKIGATGGSDLATASWHAGGRMAPQGVAVTAKTGSAPMSLRAGSSAGGRGPTATIRHSSTGSSSKLGAAASRRAGSSMSAAGGAPASSPGRGSSLGAPAGGTKMSSLLRKLPPPADALPGASSEFGAPALAGGISSNMPPADKAAKAAERVRALASQRPENAWRALKDEFGVQQLVWESLGRTGKGNPEVIANAKTYLEELLDKRKANPSAALRSIEELIKPGGGRREASVLSNSIKKALALVVAECHAVGPRSQLAERLDTAAIPATLPTSDVERRELDQLVHKCALDDAKFERQVRKMLLLPLPLESAGESSTTAAALRGGSAPALERAIASAPSTGLAVGTVGPPSLLTGTSSSSLGGVSRRAPPVRRAQSVGGTRPGVAAARQKQQQRLQQQQQLQPQQRQLELQREQQQLLQQQLQQSPAQLTQVGGFRDSGRAPLPPPPMSFTPEPRSQGLLAL